MVAAKKTYWEKLKDPRWQRKRLEVLEANDFLCQKCFDGESTLHVHHKEYFKGHEPWEYEMDQLTVLCESCHESHHEYKDLLKYVSSHLDFDGPRDRNCIALMIAGYIGMDYQSLLEGSDWEDCPASRAFYDMGIRVSNTDLNFKSFMTEEEKNG